MPGLYGIYSKYSLEPKYVQKIFNSKLCKTSGSINHEFYTSNKNDVHIGWRGPESISSNNYFRIFDDYVISATGWFSTNQNNLDFTEFIYRLFKKYRNKFCMYIEGHYFISVFDIINKNLFLFGDHFGLRPHFYHINKNLFSFSYEVGALIYFNRLNTNLDMTTLSNFLSYEYILENHTWHPDIKMVLPGQFLHISQDLSVQISKYWELDYAKYNATGNTSSKDHQEHCLKVFNEAVQKCITTTDKRQKILLTLSGGLDTRAIISAIQPDQFENTVSVTHGLPNCSNRLIGKQLASLLNTNHFEYDFNPNWLVEQATEISWLTSGHESLRHTHSRSYFTELSNLAASIVIGGLGGEFIRGFFYDFGNLTILGKFFNKLEKFKRINLITKLLHKRMTYTGLSNDQKKKLIRPEYYQQIKDKEFSTLHKIFDLYNFDNAIFFILDKFYLEQRVRRLAINGQLYTWDHLETRWPFMDFNFINIVSGLPYEWKIGAKFHRYIISSNQPELMNIPLDSNLKPISLNPPKLSYIKKYFSKKNKLKIEHPYTNYNLWFKHDLNEWIESTLLSKTTLCYEYFDPKEIKRIWESHLNGRNNEKTLSILLTLEIWLKTQNKYFSNKE
jgi:asparagine synthase (glutamine-hydrolysing)